MRGSEGFVGSYEIKTMYTQKDFRHLLGFPGLSDTLLSNHFLLYEGYVSNVNKLYDALVELKKNDKFTTPEFAEMNRRFGWEWNGMRLHELYFENITKEQKMDIGERMMKAIEKEWGSREMWEKDFRAMGAMRGIGWIVLYQDGERLFNMWVNEHDTGHLSGATPLLVMDVFEHAFALDYGIKRAEYIEVFMRGIDWKVVEERLTIDL